MKNTLFGVFETPWGIAPKHPTLQMGGVGVILINVSIGEDPCLRTGTFITDAVFYRKKAYLGGTPPGGLKGPFLGPF